MSTNQLFPTSVVGSLPRPDHVKDLINDAAPVPPDEYRRLMGLAVCSAVALQELAGLDVVTDGEWWRKSYIGVIAELAHGFRVDSYPDGRPARTRLNRAVASACSGRSRERIRTRRSGGSGSRRSAGSSRGWTPGGSP